MDNFRRQCCLAAFLVTYFMLLSLRGFSLHEHMEPADVRGILATLTAIGIISIVAFLFFIDKYSEQSPQNHHADSGCTPEQITVQPRQYDSTEPISRDRQDTVANTRHRRQQTSTGSALHVDESTPLLGQSAASHGLTSRTRELENAPFHGYTGPNAVYTNPNYGDNAGEPCSVVGESAVSNAFTPQGRNTTGTARAEPSHGPSSHQRSPYNGAASQGPTPVYMFLGSNPPNSRSLTYFLAKYSHTMAVYIFGGGIIVLNVFHVFFASQCLHYFEGSAAGLGAEEKEDMYSYSDEASRIVSSLMKILFFTMEIPLLHYLSSVKSLKCKTISQYILLPIMGANFAVWLYTFLDETKIIHLYNFHYPTEPYVYNLSVACQNHSSVTEIYMRQSMYKIFYPISMEFCIASFEILHHVYFAPVVAGNVHDAHEYSTEEQDQILQTVQSFADTNEKIQAVSFFQQSATNPIEAASPRCSLTTDVLMMVPRKIKDKVEQTKFQKILEHCLIVFHPCTALALGLMEASAMKITLLHDDVMEYHYISNHYLYAVCKIPMLAFRVFFNCIPLIFATSFCLWVICSFTKKRKTHGICWSLILGLLGISVISIYKIALCFIKMKKMGDEDRTERSWMYALLSHRNAHLLSTVLPAGERVFSY